MSDDTANDTPMPETSTDPSYFRILVAAVSDGGVLCAASQTQENGPFGDFSSVVSDEQEYNTGLIAASTTLDGYVAIAATSSVGVTYVAENPEGSDSNRWLGAVVLPYPDGVTGLSSISMQRGLSGRDSILISNGSLWFVTKNSPTIKQEQVTETPPGTTEPITVTVNVSVPPAQPWGSWVSLGGSSLANYDVGMNGNGALVIVAVDQEGAIQMKYQTNLDPDQNPTWSDWSTISGSMTGVSLAKTILDGQALVHQFAVKEGAIYTRQQSKVGSMTDFTDWALFYQASSGYTISDLALGVNGNDGLYAAWQVLEGGSQPVNDPIYGSYQTFSGDPVVASWSTPAVIGTLDAPVALSMIPNADTDLSLFYFAPQNSSSGYITQVLPNSDKWSASWTELGSDLSTIALTVDLTPTVTG